MERLKETRGQKTDQQLVDLVRAGETRQFEELVTRYQDRVYGMARRFLDSPADAEDVAQEVFLRVHRGLERFKGDAQFSTWLYRVTWNLCADWVRRKKNRRGLTVSIEDAGDIQDSRRGHEDGLLDEEERRGVRRALEELDDKYRSVLILHYYQKLSYEQIAAVMDVPLKTVETRLYRARRHLRVRLEEQGGGG